MIELTHYNRRMVVLWVLGILAYLGYAYFATNETNLEYRSNISLINSQEIITVVIILIILAILSIILKGSMNRSTNLIGGAVLGLGFLAAFIDAVTVNLNGIYNLMIGTEVIIMIIIILFSYRQPKM